MGFHEPHQQAHKIAGMRAAAASPKTPAHLKACLERCAQEGEMKGMGKMPMGMSKSAPKPGKKKGAKKPMFGKAKPDPFYGE